MSVEPRRARKEGLHSVLHMSSLLLGASDVQYLHRLILKLQTHFGSPRNYGVSSPEYHFKLVSNKRVTYFL